MDVQENVQRFMKHWNAHIYKHQVDFADKMEISRKKLNIWLPLLKSFGLRFLAANLCALIGFTWQYSNPLVGIYLSFHDGIKLFTVDLCIPISIF